VWQTDTQTHKQRDRHTMMVIPAHRLHFRQQLYDALASRKCIIIYSVSYGVPTNRQRLYITLALSTCNQCSSVLIIIMLPVQVCVMIYCRRHAPITYLSSPFNRSLCTITACRISEIKDRHSEPTFIKTFFSISSAWYLRKDQKSQYLLPRNAASLILPRRAAFTEPSK